MKRSSFNKKRRGYFMNAMGLKIKGLLFSLLLFPISSFAQQSMSPLGIYMRCYSQLTQTRAHRTDQRTIEVENGTKDPLTACLELLNTAVFDQNGNTQIADTNTEGKKVLKTLHYFHSSWFQNKDFEEINNDSRYRGVLDLFDSSSPALYYTKELFSPNGTFSTIFTGAVNLKPVRTDQDPTNGARTGADKSAYMFGVNTIFAPRGELLGVESTDLLTTAYTYNGNTGTIDLGAAFGGGILGNQVYLLQNVQENSGFRSDGAVQMPRKWARSVFEDLLCREIPVIRPEDATPFVDTNSSVPFRTSTTCTQCHASADRMASVVRGFRYTNLGDSSERGGHFPRMEDVTRTAETGWPAVRDTVYYQRPTNGTLYYRDHNGNLIDLALTGVEDLGTKLRGLDGVYLCAAKRYYEYFTGISVDIGDPQGISFSNYDLAQRNRVISLGQNLKSHQSLRKLIEEIITLPEYSTSSFGIVERSLASE